ncbi:FimV/HubP family polar landmark protein [Conchiformibius steedae]|uniref:FimV N-terminal domain-containing protein n=1 Tax=Conchiformibius steedae TaxID=153493 RepID=A0A3P2A6H3_9NEIS|nr:FimV/HubP family polar landmark protein [Conchiformibius steedae]RRD90989.1 hypothetical protein EII21_03280 [Conchiformibius steedae]
MNTNIKIIVASVSLAASVSAWGAMGGLNVRSHLGEPFAGSITVSGDEAKALMEGGRLSVSGGVRGSVSKNGNGTVTVHLRSATPVHEPVLSFTVSAGQQTRQYTALLDPPRYKPAKPKAEPKPKPEKPRAEVKPSAEKGVKVPINQDFIEKKKTENDSQPKAAPNEKTKTRAQEKAERKPAAEPQQRNAETAKVKKPSKAAVTPRRHRAYAGEKLADIAARYRPHNMSQQTAMRALVMANPRAFRHGTTVRRSVTLYIPTEAQWHVYAQRAAQQQQSAAAPQRRAAPAPRPIPAPAAPAPQPNAVAPSSVAPVTPPPQPSVAPPPPQTAASVNDAPNAVPSAAASAQTPPTVSDAASDTAAVSDTASSDVSAAVVPPPVPTPPPVADNGASEVVEEEGEESDNTLMWAMAGAGALAVGGLVAGGLLLMRRRRQQGGNDASAYAPDDGYIDDDDVIIDGDDDDQWDVDKEPASTAQRAKDDLSRARAAVESHGNTAAAAAVGAAGAAAAADYVAEEDDGVFFGSDSPAQTDAAAPADADDNWDWLEGAGKTHAAPADSGNDFEVDDWSLEKEGMSDGLGSDFEVDDWSVEKENAAAAAPNLAKENEFVVSDDEFGDFGDFGDFNLDDSPAPAAPVATPAPAADDGLGDFGDFGDFNLDDIPAAPAAAAAAPAMDDLDAFAQSALEGLDSFELPDAAQPPQPHVSSVSVPSQNSGFADLSFDSLDDLVLEDTPAAPAPADDLDSLADAALQDLDSFELPPPDSVDMSAMPDNSGLDGLSFDDFSLPEAPAAAPATAPADDLDALAAAALDGLDLPDMDDLPAAPQQATDTSLPDFGDLDFSGLESLVEEKPAAAPSPAAATPLADDLPDFALNDIETAPVGSAPALDDLDFSGLDAFVSTETPAPKPAAAEPAAAAVADMDFGDFSDFDYGDTVVTTAPAQADFGAAEPFEQPADKPNSDTGLSSLLDEKLAAKLADLNMADVLTPVSNATPKLVVETPETHLDSTADNGLADFDLSLPDDSEHELDAVDRVLANQAAAAMGDALPEEESWLNDLDSLHIAEDDFAANGNGNGSTDLTELENFDANWGADDEPALSNVGFVSEAVGTEEPQEAKLELAKMYVEIEDLSAARETLGELVAESSGEVKAEAERLLAQLG